MNDSWQAYLDSLTELAGLSAETERRKTQAQHAYRDSGRSFGGIHDQADRQWLRIETDANQNLALAQRLNHTLRLAPVPSIDPPLLQPTTVDRLLQEQIDSVKWCERAASWIEGYERRAATSVVSVTAPPPPVAAPAVAAAEVAPPEVAKKKGCAPVASAVLGVLVVSLAALIRGLS